MLTAWRPANGINGSDSRPQAKGSRMDEGSKAKRGDLIVVHCENRYYVNGEGARVSQDYRVGVVTSTTRDGHVRHYREATESQPMKYRDMTLWKRRPTGFKRFWIVSQDCIDVAKALETAAANPWNLISLGTGKPYGSLKEVQDALRPHLKSDS